MLLKQFSQVAEIDDMINQIHEELTELYRERSSLIDGKNTQPQNLPKQVATKKNDWAKDQYQQLQSAWAMYEVTIPTYSSLKVRLLKAYKVVQDLSAAKPECELAVILVPPTSKLGFPVQEGYRSKQDFIITPDYVDASIAKPKQDRSWRMLVIAADNEAQYAGSLEMMLSKKNSKIGGHNVAALGVREYTALTLQLSNPIDTQTWTILPKSTVSGHQVACVAYIDGQYRFDVDEISDVFDDNRFRAAVEVKA